MPIKDLFKANVTMNNHYVQLILNQGYSQAKVIFVKVRGCDIAQIFFT